MNSKRLDGQRTAHGHESIVERPGRLVGHRGGRRAAVKLERLKLARVDARARGAQHLSRKRPAVRPCYLLERRSRARSQASEWGG